VFAQPWSKAEPRALARYVTPEAVRHVVLPDAGGHVGAGELAELSGLVYNAVKSLGIGYSLEGYDPRAEVQHVRTPAEVAAAPRQGTCLDLATFYAGLCLGFDLLPFLVVLEDHALVVVSTAVGRRDWDAYARADRQHFDRGLLTDADALRRLVDDGEAVAVECTGFARVADPMAMGLDSEGRTPDGLPFEAAVAAGRRRLDRPLQFALDVAELHYRWQVTPFAAVDPELLAQLVERLETQFRLTPADEAMLPAVQLRDRLARLFERHTLFGGRDRELAALDAFVAERSSGYAFVTARSGFGKSALLANWIRSLEARGQRVCYHFISRTDGVADQDTTLRSLCQQLAHAHGLRGELPDTVQSLRALYTTLLATPQPGGAPLVVVLDGLDEADRWEPAVGPDMFPSRLGEGTRLVFSARDVAGKDWIADLELRRAAVTPVVLSTLGAGEIAGLLRAAGDRGAALADDATFVAAALDRSQGDPFYLHYLAQDVQDGVVTTVEQVRDQPQGLNAYLDKWWDEVSRAAGEQAASDLLGYLLVAAGPVPRRDLTDISQTDALTGLTFRRTLDLVRRYLVGGDTDGYALCHPRFRDYVAAQVGDVERGRYLETLVSYCERWPAHRSAYALRFLPAHLVELGRRDDLPRLFSPEWIAAVWQVLRTYSPLVEALGLATQACLHDPPAFNAIPGLTLARQTARELMLGFPADLLAAWVDMGEADRAVQVVDTLGDARGYAAERAMAVAAALLRQPPRERVDEVAARLVRRAAGLLPFRRNSDYKLETLAQLRPLLQAGIGLSDTHRREILGAVEAFALSEARAELQVIGLGLAAEAWASSAGGFGEARRALDLALQRLPALEAGTDRAVVASFLAPAIRAVAPARIAATVIAEVEAVPDPSRGSSLFRDPLGAILDNVRPSADADGVALVRSLCDRCLGDPPNGFAAGRLARASAAAGAGGDGLDLLKRLWDSAPPADATLAVATAMPMDGVDVPQVAALFDRAVHVADPANGVLERENWAVTSAVAEAAARLGRWEVATAAAGWVPARDRKATLVACLRIARDTGLSGDALQRVVETLLAGADDVEAEARADILGAGALCLARAGNPEARAVAAKAAGVCLAQLPEGDTDDLWAMVALAHGQAGDGERACAAVARMPWKRTQGDTLAVLAGLAAGNGPELERVAGAMEALIAGDREQLYEDGLIAILNGLTPIVDTLPGRAEALLDAAWDAVASMTSLWSICRCAEAETTARARLNRVTAVEHLELLFRLLTTTHQGGGNVGPAETGAVINAAVVLAPASGTWAASIEERLEALLDATKEDRDPLIPLVAVTDPARAAGLLAEKIGRLPAMAEDRGVDISMLLRMFHELAGKRYSPRERQIGAVGSVASGIARVASADLAAATPLVRRLLEAARQVLEGDDLADALQGVVRGLASGPPQLLVDAVQHLGAQVDGLGDPEARDRVREALAVALAGHERFDAAEAVVETMAPGEAKDRTRGEVEGLRALAALGELSPLEQHFLAGDDPGLKRAALMHLRTEGTADDLLRAATAALIDNASVVDMHKLLGTFAPLMLLPAHGSGGPALMTEIVEELDAWRARFLDAAGLIGAAA
jgi:hypothetical protein